VDSVALFVAKLKGETYEKKARTKKKERMKNFIEKKKSIKPANTEADYGSNSQKD